MALATIAGAQLTAALKPQLTLLVDDMRARLNADTHELENWRTTHREAVREQRTATSWTDWSEDQLTQAAVGWLLTSVFVRFCEDNLLLGDTAVWIAGPTPLLRQRAVDAENSFYREHQDCSYREWLEQSFDALRRNPATQALVDEHAALNIISPSSDAVQQLLGFWRQTDDTGELAWSFHDDALTTRFLGDLYQDLSDFAKKKYALLQTPEFVEEFILDQTLEPALKDRPLEGFKIIDPTCGSGHFLLGAFARLVERWHRHAPGLELRTRVDNALASIYGVDLNPFAVAIAKFRLIVAALQACGEKSLINAPKFTLNLAAGDSLLHGPEQGGKEAFDFGDAAFDKDAVASGFTYSTEDARVLRRILAPGQYDAVVGNPPYITVSDKALNARYREIYHHCKGTYALTVPFMEKFFDLANPGERAGWVGQITSNSFMKREFGVPLIEEFLARKDLRLVADTSGAYIPGHGTPTVILVGRNQSTVHDSVRAVLGIEGEPGAPANPAKGLVWTSIVDHIDRPGYEDQWVSIADLPRTNLNQHPWSLSGGGAVETLSAIDEVGRTTLGDRCDAIGRTTHTGLDDAFYVTPQAARTRDFSCDAVPIVLGEDVRDYAIAPEHVTVFPYDRHGLPKEVKDSAFRTLWLNRTALSRRIDFKQTLTERGLRWFDHSMFFPKRYRSPFGIAFAFVATHNHFVLDRGGKVFKQSAPVIKLPEGASEDDHLRLLGTLNSSTACFWLKQNSHNKGEGGGARVDAGYAAMGSELWKNTYEFTGTTLKDFPLTKEAPLERARRIDTLSHQLAAQEPAAAIEAGGATRATVDTARVEHNQTRAQMIAEQDELDWEVYRHYGLVDEDLTVPVGQAPRIALGERSFEIALERKIAAGEAETEWFTRHGSTPITEIPAHWPSEYRELVEKRLAAIESNPFIRLLERPEYKRRWAGDSWDVKLQRALKDWLLDKLEDPALWFTPHGTPLPRSVGELAGHVEKDSEFIEALDLWAGQKDAPVTATLVKLLSDEAVPYLAALRYKDSGLRKRAEWDRVWDLQRDEDAGLIKATDIPVPPKYTSTDFLKSSYWSHRGKLDVPKERFIAYPDAGRDTDPTPLLGWAGWNHAQQGLALATIYALRESEGTALTALVPVVAGIAEVLPWVKQWHSGVDPNLGLDLAEYLSNQLAEKSAAVGVPVQDLPAWRPEKKTRGRKAATRKAGQ
ncbi:MULTISPECIES: BREX-2 system adenine-specific DNA-methyltransferase PglX [unclassified Rhodococcus (in: high G+C Gram-positive bacteria)]|uniref:BREX-2 system adenine-specific DNA-methyltransferase PglX n=1 Tax=unclassified Rhodococcus (in: high G+C Gram-positive bacteria) TaxID=192944 RepID=UPI0009284789|nr:BREX-2 system adenine-specific DNA-methyltransferase PglX [Rhodococcus sp. M8]OLL18357.1 DNA methylase [Rhodococcus sp. M8]QPG45415.1 BREX-2 system adenine-specific DNA-methyltransferase PglX [Rhodococcus sp. M8]